ncbi:MAG: indole-3-glycerol phosphate synthase TrpC [Chloracidobacterium sp.]|nr:indole-3-glycerol phosphate synthase TrpC [Chloracidobacterium sp.]
MTGTILDTIIDAKRSKVETLKQQTDLAELIALAENVRRERDTNRMFTALAGSQEPRIITEFKRASPSKGVINDKYGPVETALAYQKGGAAAISVLTEEDHFGGSLEDLKHVRDAVELPILRKDFVIDEFQIYESAAAGADAVLLIVSALTSESLQDFQRLAHSLGLDAIVEVHDREEMARAIDVGAALIGVNNRNLRTFEVSLDTSRELIEDAPNGTIMIAESGITGRDEIRELFGLGYAAFLVGESLMRSGDPAAEIRRLNGQG